MSLERFEAAAATARKGEFAAFGTFPRGTLLFVMPPNLCGAGDKNTAAMRKNAGFLQRLGQ